MDIQKKMEKNQTVEKFGLLTAGSLLIPAGIALCQGADSLTGVILIVLGVSCLLARELIKLRR